MIVAAQRIAVQLPRARHSKCLKNPTISREAVRWNGVLACADALPIGAHRFTLLERQDDAGSLPPNLERGVVQGLAQRGLDARFRIG
jgi:hypothetical protein